MEYLKNISINENIILIHGEYEGMLELNKLLENELHIKAEIPDKDWTLRL
jgi:predicted metal-dependent RNase